MEISDSEAAMETPPFRCPTCQALQVPAAECRRCKCDLTLVVGVLRSCEASARMCLRRLREGDDEAALIAAQRRYELAPDATAQRLLAVSYLRCGRFQAALDVSGLLGDA